MKYRVYVEQTAFGHVEVDEETFNDALDRAVEQFDLTEAQTAEPIALTVERLEIREGKEVWVGA